MLFKNLKNQSSITLNSKHISYNDAYFKDANDNKISLKSLQIDYENERVIFDAEDDLIQMSFIHYK